MKELFISNNAIKSLENVVIIGCETLETLDLSYNQIETISKLSFQGLERLNCLNLSNNLIRGLENFKFNSEVSLVKLHDNPIISVQRATRSPWNNSLSKITLTYSKEISKTHNQYLDYKHVIQARNVYLTYFDYDLIDMAFLNEIRTSFLKNTKTLANGRKLNIFQSVPYRFKVSFSLSSNSFNLTQFFESLCECKLLRFLAGHLWAYDSFINSKLYEQLEW